MKLVLGFAGKTEHGKTEACDAIAAHVNARGGRAKVFSISDLIIVYCQKRGELPAGFARGPHNTKAEIKTLVDGGNRRRAEEGPDCWTNELFQWIETADVDVALIPNIRFAHEAKRVKTAKGYVIRMTRLNADGSIYISQSRNPNDVTETSLDLWAADAFITVKEGQAVLTAELAITHYEFLAAYHE